MKREPIVAVAFLTQANLRAVGNNLKRIYPIEDVTPFEDLLTELDKADRKRHLGTGKQ